ncbi:MAG: type II toxin-antitoxin system RelE/ParE family toxin [Deltaproteobacteria bacterium]
MIRGCRDRRTERFVEGKRVPAFDGFRAAARRTLARLHAATVLSDFRPGDHLEALRGDRDGQHSIRINEQFRVCFVWREGDAHDVEIVDYH